LKLASLEAGKLTSDELVGSAISWAWANGADIISCSWLSKKHVDDIEFAVRQAAAAGRDGKGCGIFFAPGNNGRNFLDLDYCPVEMPEVITVGAIKPNDSIWDYSNYGKIDIVAPSGRSTLNPIWSLDIMDTLGYNNNYTGYGCGHEGEPNDIDYNCRFGGTSAAQPVAAGVGALVLSRRPDLTKIQLDSVIKFSADPNMYDTIVNPPDLKYGYGMVHPLRALLAVARGDVNNDKTINLLDVNYIINFLYRGGPEPIPSPLLADANCSGSSNLQDVSYIIDYLYRGGPRPSLCYKY
jgi:subtilisin family serine protease